jgi:hypothetical protein
MFVDFVMFRASVGFLRVLLEREGDDCVLGGWGEPPEALRPSSQTPELASSFRSFSAGIWIPRVYHDCNFMIFFRVSISPRNFGWSILLAVFADFTSKRIYTIPAEPR